MSGLYFYPLSEMLIQFYHDGGHLARNKIECFLLGLLKASKRYINSAFSL